MVGQENGNFPLLYVVKRSLRRWVVQKSLKTPLSNIKMAFNAAGFCNFPKKLDFVINNPCFDSQFYTKVRSLLVSYFSN